MRKQALLIAFVSIQIIAYKNGFGLPVFLVLAILSLTIFGTRDKVEGEVSAYSVFNPGGARLSGQFTAEQFDAQLRGLPPPPNSQVAPPAAPVDTGNRLGGGEDPRKSLTTSEDRRRLLALAAERRLQATASTATL